MPTPAAPDRSLSRERLVTFAFAAAELLVEIAPDASITWAAGAFPARFGEPAEGFVGRKLSLPDRAGRSWRPGAHADDRRAVRPRGAGLAAAERCRRHALCPRRPDPAGAAAAAVRDARAGAGARRRRHAEAPQPASLFAKEVEARLRGKQAGALALLDVTGWPAATDDASQQQRDALRDAVGDALGQRGWAG